MLMIYTGESDGSFNNGSPYFYNIDNNLVNNCDGYNVHIDSVNQSDFITGIMSDGITRTMREIRDMKILRPA